MASENDMDDDHGQGDIMIQQLRMLEPRGGPHTRMGKGFHNWNGAYGISCSDGALVSHHSRC